MVWLRRLLRRTCERHTWAPWIQDPATHTATRHCLFCGARWVERLAE